MNKTYLTILAAFISMQAIADGYSNWAVPTEVELVSGGVLIHGAFGDPNPCGKANYIFVSQQSPTFDATLSIAISALHGNREMRLYSNKCIQVSFHWLGEIINENRNGQTVSIR